MLSSVWKSIFATVAVVAAAGFVALVLTVNGIVFRPFF